VQPHEGAAFYKVAVLDDVAELRLLGDPVESDVDGVALPAGLHLDPAPHAVRDEGRSPDALQGVAELAAGRADVVRLVADPDQVVERAVDGGGRQARPVVPDADRVGLNGNGDLRRDVGRLASVQCVVDQLLDQGDGPLPLVVADLHRQFFLAEELQEAAGLEGRAAKHGRRRAHPSLSPTSSPGSTPSAAASFHMVS
jgi:hypothetical protein